MDKKSRNIFYAVLIVATLIVALVGTSLAYFSYRTSSKDDDVKARSAIINIIYDDSKQVTAQADELIPATLDVVKNVYQTHISNSSVDSTPSSNLCIDSKGQQVCSVYRFSVVSDIDVETYATLNTEDNEFTYLAFAVRDVNNNTWLKLENNKEYLKLAKCSNRNDNKNDDCYTGTGDNKKYNLTPKAINSIFGYNNNTSLKNRIIGTTQQVYDIVVFIDENNKNQNIDQGKKYEGTIYVTATDDFTTILDGKK